MLIGTRALMGVGGAFIMPATLSILTNVFTDPKEGGKAIGIWAGVSALGLGFGPITGGFLLAHFWWGSIFLVNIPIVIAGLFLGYRYIPESKDPAPSKADPLGALFSAASGAITLTFLCLFGMIFLLTQYLQSVLGYGTITAGAVLVPQAVVIMIAAPLSSVWVNKLGNNAVVAGGLFVCSLAFVAFTQFTVTTPVTAVILLTMMLGLGMGNVMAPATGSIMGSLPRAKAGVGSAMNDTTRQTGGAVGVAVLGSLLSSRYGPEMTAKLTGKVPAEFIEPLKDSIGKTLGIAEKAPAAVRPLIESAARESFVSGMHLASIVAAGILLVAALSVLKWPPTTTASRRLRR